MMNYVDLFTRGGNIPLLYLISFVGGLIASLSPCSLAMLPIIVGYVGGYSDAKPTKTFMQLLFFILGSAIVFSVIGRGLSMIENSLVFSVITRDCVWNCNKYDGK